MSSTRRSTKKSQIKNSNQSRNWKAVKKLFFISLCAVRRFFCRHFIFWCWKVKFHYHQVKSFSYSKFININLYVALCFSNSTAHIWQTEEKVNYIKHIIILIVNFCFSFRFLSFFVHMCILWWQNLLSQNICHYALMTK